MFKPVSEGSKPSEADFEVADVTKVDPTRDLALLHIASVPQTVRPIALGSEIDIQVGADVHAIGHPTGEAWTYTRGFISQYRKDYEWKTEGGIHKASVIQTQTPINPGNSGGPLLSDDGKLIGVNAFKASGEGLNFAVSITDVQMFLAKTGNAVLANAPSGCKPTKLYEGRDSQNIAQLVQYDTNCDGKPDYSFVSPDDALKPFFAHIDTNFDGRTDITVEDRNRDMGHLVPRCGLRRQDRSCRLSRRRENYAHAFRKVRVWPEVLINIQENQRELVTLPPYTGE